MAYRRVAMAGADAVVWYRALSTRPTLPIPSDEADRGRFDGTALTAAVMTDEPVWPSLSTPLANLTLFGSGDDLYPTPFIGAGSHPARVHRQLAVPTPLLERVLDDQVAIAWLKRRIHFDIGQHEELLGGAVLVVPDPDVRGVRSFMARDANGDEHLVGEVLPRIGGSLDGLTLTLFEERFGAMHLFESRPVDGSLMIVRGQGELERTGYSLSHGERGLVERQEALPYLRSINIDMGMMGRRVQIETTADRSKDAALVTHEVREVSSSPFSVPERSHETPRPRDPASRFYDGAERRRRTRLARQQQMTWFENREEAQRFIRARIGQARSTLMIADPFADAKDLFDFGHFVTRTHIELRLLTSRLPFKNMDKSAIVGSFATTLRSFPERGLPEPQVRLLPGRDSPSLHDRFLVIDEDVWLSGNSLNSIGERASMLIKLPDPTEVRDRLERLYANAEPLRLSEPKP